MLLTHQNNKDIEELLVKLSEFESVTKALQEDTLSVSDTRALFDGVIDSFPETKDRLSKSANIVHDKVFEDAVTKIQDGKLSELTLEERLSVSNLQIEETQDSNEVSECNEEERNSLAERVLKKRRMEASEIDRNKKSKYMDLKFIIPTSNICERLFSAAGYGLNDRRQAILPANFEYQMFLDVNNDIWGVQEVNKIMYEVGNES